MEVFIAIKAWIGALFPAAVGSALSIYLGKEKSLMMSRIELFGVFFFGVIIAHYMGGAAIEYSHIPPQSMSADAIKFTTGLIGMATVASALIQVPLALVAFRKKWLGE